MAAKKLSAKEERELEAYITQWWGKGMPLTAESYNDFKSEYLATKRKKKKKRKTKALPLKKLVKK